MDHSEEEEHPRELNKELINFYNSMQDKVDNEPVPESSSSLADSPHKHLVPETITINSVNFDKKLVPAFDEKQYSSV